MDKLLIHITYSMTRARQQHLESTLQFRSSVKSIFM